MKAKSRKYVLAAFIGTAVALAGAIVLRHRNDVEIVAPEQERPINVSEPDA